jgi:hypothetical protein
MRPRFRSSASLRVRLAVLLAAGLGTAGCSQQVQVGAAASSRDDTLQDRIAQALLAASPPAEPSGAAARDAAAERLAESRVWLEATGDRLLWGGFDAAKGFDFDQYRLTQFNPLVWTKLYLSTFVFTGAYTVRREQKYTILEMAVQFRAALDPGDYPYPFWHNPQKWQAYATTNAVLFVFERDRVVAAFRRADPTAAATPAKPWDGHWHWQDDNGAEQPRVALYSYLLSADNPSRARLEAAYRNLESAFRSHNCTACHAPDNMAGTRELTLLDYPNQALVARHSLVEVLRRKRMPPANDTSHTPAGIATESERQELVRLAEEFEHLADAALDFERARAK